MNPLANLTYSNDIKHEKDRVGGGSFIVESGVYLATIKHAYIKQSAGGAYGLAVQLDLDNGQTVLETLWVTNKQGQNFYTTQNGEKHYLAGFTLADSISLLTLEKPISTLTTETGLVEMWSSTAQDKVPTKVPVYTQLLGKQIKVGVIKEVDYKRSYNDATGAWEDSDETREYNVIDKFFRASDDKTVDELRTKVEEATFINKWSEVWAGKTRDKTAKKAKPQPSRPTAQAPAKTSMFG